MNDERDYEQIVDDREQERAERQMHRLDNRHGRVEDWRRPRPETVTPAR